MDYQLIPLPSLQDNYIWLLVNTVKRCVLVVDPGEAQPVLEYLQIHQLTLSAILITHHHWDHTNGVSALVAAHAAPVYGSVHTTNVPVTVPLRAGDTVNLAFFPVLTCLEIPGHTLDHIAYYAAPWLFCGDTLFAAGCGRLFEGSASQLYLSLQTLAQLPLNTQICCAHEYTVNNLRFAHAVEPDNVHITERLNQACLLRSENLPTLPSRLSDEKATNPFLRTDIAKVRQSIARHAKTQYDTPVDWFAALRRWKDCF